MSGTEEPDRREKKLADRAADELASELEYDLAHLPAPLEPIVLVLGAGQRIDWDAAKRSIDSVDAGDLDYIYFALGISQDDQGGVVNALRAARDLLHAELGLLRDAVAMPDSAEFIVCVSQDGSLRLGLGATPPASDWQDPSAVYGALVRLGLMYVTDAAGLGRPDRRGWTVLDEPDEGTPA
jgi:hypothetical protein